MSKIFARFDSVTRDCKGQLSTSNSSATLPVKEGFIFVELMEKLDNANDYYLDEDGIPAEKHSLPLFDKYTILADGLDTATLSGLPEGARFFIFGLGEDIEGEVDSSGTLEITCDTPTTLIIDVMATNHKRTTYEVTVT